MGNVTDVDTAVMTIGKDGWETLDDDQLGREADEHHDHHEAPEEGGQALTPQPGAKAA